MKRVWFLASVVAALSCDDLPKEPGGASNQSWSGVYTVRAETARVCVETTTPTGRTCDCSETGHLEGALTLAAATDGKPTGDVTLRECFPGRTPACGADVSYAVVPFTGPPNPNPPPGERLSFCARKCPFAGNDGGIHFIDAAIASNSLTGHFWRADGNVRGCGSDSGPFTAIRP